MEDSRSLSSSSSLVIIRPGKETLQPQSFLALTLQVSSKIKTQRLPDAFSFSRWLFPSFYMRTHLIPRLYQRRSGGAWWHSSSWELGRPWRQNMRSAKTIIPGQLRQNGNKKIKTIKVSKPRNWRHFTQNPSPATYLHQSPETPKPQDGKGIQAETY